MAGIPQKHNKARKTPNKVDVSVCSGPQEAERLMKLFEVFLRIDKRLRKQNEERNSQ